VTVTARPMTMMAPLVALQIRCLRLRQW